MTLTQKIMRLQLTARSATLGLLLALGLLTGCMEYDAPLKEYRYHYPGDRPMVHGILSANDGLSVWLEMSHSPLDTLLDHKGIEGAQVELLADGLPFLVLAQAEPGLYHSPTDVNFPLDKEYALRVTHPTLPVMLSEGQRIPPRVLIDSAKLEVMVAGSGSSSNFITIHLTDPGGMPIYYSYTYSYFFLGQEYFNDGLLDPRVLFSNESISGRSHSFTTHLYWINTPEGANSSRPDSIRVYLYTLSHGLYQFKQSLRHEGGEGFMPHHLPYVHTNIHNGLGVFGAISSDAKTLRLPQRTQTQ